MVTGAPPWRYLAPAVAAPARLGMRVGPLAGSTIPSLTTRRDRRRRNLAAALLAALVTGMPLAVASASQPARSAGRARQGATLRLRGGAASRPGVQRAAAGRLVSVGGPLELPTDLVRLGPMNPDATVRIDVALRLSDPAGLATYATAVTDPSSPAYHRYLSPAQLTAAFGPTAAQASAVVRALRSAGLEVGAVPANRLLISASGDVRSVSAALHTTFDRVRLGSSFTGWSALGAAQLPSSLAGSVAAVVGLNDLPASANASLATASPSSAASTAAASLSGERSLATASSSTTDANAASGATGSGSGLTPGGASGAAPVAVATADPRQLSIAGAPAGDRNLPRACADATDTAVLDGGWTDDAVANAYGFAPLLDHGDLGQGETIALWEEDQFSMQDIANFERCYFGRSRTSQLTLIPLDGYQETGPNYEATLDIEQVASLAPDAKILVYEDNPAAPSQFAEYEAIISQDRANIVSMSYGGCEALQAREDPGFLQVENSLFEEAAAEGITWIASSADDGADTCSEFVGAPAPPDLSTSDPASQPFVLSVGGVSMETDATPPQETVWNDGAGGGGSGGGVSTVWSSPAWQADSGVPGTKPGKRQVPDVSAVGNEYRGVAELSSAFTPPQGPHVPLPLHWNDIGGTSVAAPEWAAALAIVADSPGCSALTRTAGGPDLGFVSPALYQIAAHPRSYDESFTQVTEGNNDVYGTGKGYSAHAGYNEVTGLGTPVLAGPTGGPGLAANLCAIASGHPLAGGSAPVVSSLSPASGSAAGGTTVTISGSGFPSGTSSSLQVEFGTSPATVVSATPTSLVVVTPSAPAVSGAPSFTAPTTVAVTVSDRNGPEELTSFPSKAAQYGYVQSGPTTTGAPTVAAVDPDGSAPGGGRVITIYGAGFTSGGGVTSVTFGGVPAAGFQVLGDDRLAVTVPAETAATACATGTGFTPASDCQVEVVVTTAAGSSPTATIRPSFEGATSMNSDGSYVAPPETEISEALTEFDYAPPPVITAISPNPAAASGQSPVTIIGRNLVWLAVPSVEFGPTANENSLIGSILYESPSKIVVLPPASPAGATPGPAPQPLPGGVTVNGIGGSSNTKSFGYAGIPIVRSISAHGGPALGGTPLTITGKGLSDVKGVAIVSPIPPLSSAGVLSTVYVIHHVSDNEITLRMPAFLESGIVLVLPCSLSGCAAPDPQTELFAYYDVGHPTLLAPSVTTGPASGGTRLLLSGYNIDSSVAVRFGPNPATIVPLPAADGGGPLGDPYLLAVDSAPGAPGSTVPITVITPTGISTAGSFHYTVSAPAPPFAPSVTPTPGGTVLSWKAPLSDGGSPVTAIDVVAVPQHSGPAVGVRLAASASSYRFVGLHAATAYDFSLTASNATHGTGPAASLDGVPIPYEDNGYRVATAAGVVAGVGSLAAVGGVEGQSSSPVVGIAATGDAHGYWVAQADGTVTAFGDAPALPYAHPSSPVTAIAPTGDGKGYWLLESNGTVLGFGDAHVAGPAHRLRASATAVAIVPQPGGLGYLVLDSAGTVYAYNLTRPGVAVIALPLPAGTSAVGGAITTSGFVALVSNGAVVTVAAAPGHRVSAVLPAADGTPEAIVATPDGKGYWVLASSGAVVGRGDAYDAGGVHVGTSQAVAIAGP